MLQALESIQRGLREVPLPRLTQQQADLMYHAASALSFERLSEDGVEDMRPEEHGGIVALHLLLSALVAKYGAEVVSATAHDLETEQNEALEDYVQSLLNDMPNGVSDDDQSD